MFAALRALEAKPQQVGALLFAGTIAARLVVAAGVLPRCVCVRDFGAASAASTAPTAAQTEKERLSPPVAKRVPHKLYFGVRPVDPEAVVGDHPMDPPLVREDEYFWLRDDSRERPEVIAHLEAENAYAAQEMAHLEALQGSLYEEMLSHMKETDEELPYRHGDFLYYTRTEKGKAYKIHCRKAHSPNAAEEIILDENVVAEGQAHADVGCVRVSPSHRGLAYSVDHTGFETYSVHVIRDLRSPSREEEKEIVSETDGTVVWGADDSLFFYLAMDAEHRPDRVFLHRVGTAQSEDVLLFQEDDARFWLGVHKTKDERFLVISSASKETSEEHVLALLSLTESVRAAPLSQSLSAAEIVSQQMVCVRKREQGLRYELEHHCGFFYLVTNLNGAVNNKLVRVPASRYFPSVGDEAVPTSEWEEVRAYNPEEQIDEVLPFERHMAVFGRRKGVSQLWIVPFAESDDTVRAGEWQTVHFPEEAFSLYAGANKDYRSSSLRIVYSSFLTPRQVIDYEFATSSLLVRKQQEVPGYEKTHYVCRRTHALSRDGVARIPISLVFHRKLLSDSDNNTQSLPKGVPVLLDGYGSYGSCNDPYFDFKQLSLLDRGVVFAIAHIRGGGEMGRSWYEPQGKYLQKMNTFFDFIDCAQMLVDEQVTTPRQLAITGASAGGLLIGATLNLAPSLFKAAFASVPFVDVMNTMSDASIPLTVTEWEEWGNPNEAAFHEYMLGYSPYDNVRAQEYPALLVTAGLNDPRVAYWEPAKWVAKLRATKTDKNPLLFKTDLSSGHFSASDRYKYVRETAFQYAFILDQLDAKNKL